VGGKLVLFQFFGEAYLRFLSLERNNRFVLITLKTNTIKLIINKLLERIESNTILVELTEFNATKYKTNEITPRIDDNAHPVITNLSFIVFFSPYTDARKNKVENIKNPTIAYSTIIPSI